MVGDLYRTLFRGRDLVLWEGRGNAEAPKIELLPPGLPPLNEGDATLVAVVSRQAAVGDLPCFDPDDTSPLADWVVERFRLPAVS